MAIRMRRPRKKKLGFARGEARAEKTGLKYVEPAEAAEWLAATDRSTFLIDVRSEEEYAADGLPNTATNSVGSWFRPWTYGSACVAPGSC